MANNKKRKKKGLSLQSKKAISQLTNKLNPYHHGILTKQDVQSSLNNLILSNTNKHLISSYHEMLQKPNFQEAIQRMYTEENLDIHDKPLPFYDDSSADDGLLWIGITLNQFSEKIKYFDNQRSEFERHLLHGNFDCARDSLRNITERCGESLWSITSLFSLLYFSGKDDELVTYRSTLPPDISYFSKISIIYEYTKSRSSASYESYLSSFNRQQEDLRINGHFIFEKHMSYLHDFDPSDDYGDIRITIASKSFSRLSDLYTFFVRTIRYCKLKKIPINKTLKTVEELYKSTKIRELGLLLDNDTKDTVDEDIAEVMNNYLLEDYSSVFQKSNSLLNQIPSLSIIYEILARSKIALNERSKINGPLGDVIRCIEELHLKNDVDNNKKKLCKLYLNLKQFDWSYGIKSVIDRYSSVDQGLISLKYDYSDNSQTKYNPFNFQLTGDEGNKEKLRLYFKNNKAIIALISLPHLQEGLGLPLWRRLKLSADYAFHKENYDLAINNYIQLLTIDQTRFCKQEIKSKLIYSYFLNKKYEVAIIELSKALTSDSEPLIFPLKDISKYIILNIRANDNIDLLEACVKVLYFYNINFHKEDITQELSNLCENLLSTIGYEKISDINVDEWPLSTFILTHILNVDVLEGFIYMIEDIEDVFSSRINICNKLLNKLTLDENPGLYHHVMNDHHSSFNRMVLYFCSSEDIDGRIKIEKESIKVLILDELAEEFKQLSNFEKTDEELVTLHLSEDLVTISGSELHLKLGSIFDKILKEYTINKLYGLDNSLNVGIRHSGLFNHLWAPIKVNKISGKKMENGQFNTNSIVEDFLLLRKDIRDDICDYFASFLEKTERVILNFKNKCHVDSGDFVQDEDKFFNYEIEKEWLTDFIEQYNSGKTFDYMIDSTFEIFDQETDVFLKNIREKQIKKLADDLDSEYNTLYKNLSIAPNHLRQKVSLVRTQCLERVNDLKDWFDWSGNPITPFTLGAAEEKANKLVESLHPTISMKTKCIDATGLVLDSVYFSSLVTVFSLIQENVAKHCGLINGIIIGKILTLENGALKIVCTNNVSKEKAAALPTIINIINGAIDGNIVEKASKDSGSGIYKIKSILDNKLRVKNKIHLRLENDIFYVSITIFNLGELEYENTDS